MYRLFSVLALGAALCLTWIPALADRPSPVNPAGQALGIVPTHNGAVRGSGAGQLSYHSGGVVQTGTHNTYAIYWNPWGSTDSSGYQATINQFFTDVAAASAAHATNNVYESDTQYYQTVGGTTTHVTYSENFAGSAVDTTTPSSSGCTSTAGGSLGCVSDAQVANEVDAVRTAHGWPTGAGAEYFVFLGKGVSTCSDSSHCFVSYFCAYHSSYTTGSGATVIYANMPYANYSSGACGTGQDPSGDADAQSTLNVTSHEANESITDYLGNAWYDNAGYENGDKCAWKFGTASGPAGAQYNQTINGHNYYLQGEYSNQDRGCIWSGV